MDREIFLLIRTEGGQILDVVSAHEDPDGAVSAKGIQEGREGSENYRYIIQGKVLRAASKEAVAE